MPIFLPNALPETNSSPLKNCGWKTIISFWVSAYFSGDILVFGEISVLIGDLHPMGIERILPGFHDGILLMAYEGIPIL